MTNKQVVKQQKRAIRHGRVRSRVSGTASRPRLSVFRSNSHLYVQLIDDQAGTTLAQASTTDLKEKGAKFDKSQAVGKLIADKAAKLNITQVVFDRGGYKYHGRVKAVADAAREAGLRF